ncbi:MAG: hypothetical protein AB7E70_19750, partial [Hyphomicrobiaceae bacterium]
MANQARDRGRFVKGTSGNPGGRPVTKASRAPGFDAVPGYAGSVTIGEKDASLRGSQRWQTFADLQRLPPVAVWGRLRNALFSGVKWTVVANESESPNVERAVELVEQ